MEGLGGIICVSCGCVGGSFTKLERGKSRSVCTSACWAVDHRVIPGRDQESVVNVAVRFLLAGRNDLLVSYF